MNMRKQTWEAAISAAAMCVAAAMPSYAQTESASRQLTSDETYAETLTVDSGVTLDLAGYRMGSMNEML